MASKKPPTKALADSRAKVYSIPIRSITSNTNPRNALHPSLENQGWTVFAGDKAIWPLATSDNPEDRAKFVQLLKDFDPDLVAMAQTMLTQGQLQPVEVREGGSTKGTPSFTLVFGCRRCLAILFNWCSIGRPKEPTVNATLQKGNEATLMHRAIVENIRKQPTPIEEAEAIMTMRNMGETDDEIMKATGYSASTLAKRVALLNLDKKTQDKLRSGKISAAKALAEKNGTATEPKAKLRSRKEIEAAAEEYREGTPQRAVLDWLLCRREKIG